jgi:hypothetical protein
MSKIFVKSGNAVRVRDRSQMQSYDQLPAETYTVKFDEHANEFFLEQIANFDLPTKVYGTNNTHAERILNTFNSRESTTGVLLSGIKGAGKTLLAKQTAVAAREQGIPTIVINHDWCGDDFNSFIQSITTPTIILFDEFEKIYDYTKQRKILTLFDGVYNSRKLFMVTTNVNGEVSEFLQNRPGRIYYNFSFDTLEQDFILEFLEDRLTDQTQIPSILTYTKVFSFFNFDMLSAVVEEMNRYNETLSEVLQVLNVKPENRNTDTFNVQAVFNGTTIVLDRTYQSFQPNQFEYRIWADDDMLPAVKADEEAAKLVAKLANAGSWGNANITFDPSHIKNFDTKTHCFIYSITVGDDVIDLHITRNASYETWKYNANAF